MNGNQEDSYEEAFVQVEGDNIEGGMVVVDDLDDNAAGPMDSDSDGEDGVEQNEMEEEIEDDSIHAFGGHSEAVYAVAWCPTSADVVATGGGDDKAYIWRAGESAYMENQGAVFELKGHTDTVSCLAFNTEGNLLASGGMDGRVKIWTLTGECVSTLEGPGEAIEWLQWHPKGNVVLAGSADFTAWMWNSNGTCMHVFTGHSGSVTCGGFTPDGKLVVTGGGEGDESLRVWDPKTGECRTVVQGPHTFHTLGLTSLAFHHSDPSIVLTASEDGTAKLVNVEHGRVVGTFKGHQEETSVEAVGFVANLPIVATAGMDGKLLLWDMATATIRSTCEHPDGVVKIKCHPTQPTVFTACLDGIVRCWDGRTGECLKTFRGHSDAVQDLSLNGDGTMVISGGEDGIARVFTCLM